jgi:hypothetical protein
VPIPATCGHLWATVTHNSLVNVAAPCGVLQWEGLSTHQDQAVECGRGAHSSGACCCCHGWRHRPLPSSDGGCGICSLKTATTAGQPAVSPPAAGRKGRGGSWSGQGQGHSLGCCLRPVRCNATGERRLALPWLRHRQLPLQVVVTLMGCDPTQLTSTCQAAGDAPITITATTTSTRTGSSNGCDSSGSSGSSDGCDSSDGLFGPTHGEESSRCIHGGSCLGVLSHHSCSL